MAGAGTPRRSLAELGRELQALRARILQLHEDAALRAEADPRNAAAFQAQADAQAAPLVAKGAALRDEIVLRAHARAKWAWRVVYAGCVLLAVLVGWWLLR